MHDQQGYRPVQVPGLQHFPPLPAPPSPQDGLMASLMQPDFHLGILAVALELVHFAKASKQVGRGEDEGKVRGGGGGL